MTSSSRRVSIPSAIELTFSGIAEIKPGQDGDLVLDTGAGDLIVSTPFVYQDFDGEKQQVAAAFERRGAHGAGFDLGAYDRTRPLIIDPGLEMGTFVGGSGFDSVQGVAALGDNIWVVGQTTLPTSRRPAGVIRHLSRATVTCSSPSTSRYKGRAPPSLV